MSAKSATVPSTLRGIRRGAVILTIAAVVAAAAVGIFIVLTGEFDSTTDRVMQTSIFVALFGGTALAHLAVATRQVRVVGFVGLGVSVVALTFAMIMVWVDWGNDWEAQSPWAKAAGVTALLAIFLAQVNLLLLLGARTHPAIRWSLYATFLTIVVVYALLVPPLVTDGEVPGEDISDWYWRIFQVFLILDALGTIVVPVLGGVLRGREGDARTISVSLPVQLADSLETEAKAQGRKVSELIAERLAERPASKPTRSPKH